MLFCHIFILALLHFSEVVNRISDSRVTWNPGLASARRDGSSRFEVELDLCVGGLGFLFTVFGDEDLLAG